VSYNEKHNHENGEDNRDGANDNLSWNCGAEGPSSDPEIEALRNRQVKNFLALLLLATGTPMLVRRDSGTEGPTAITSRSAPRCSARRPASRSRAREDGASTVT